MTTRPAGRSPGRLTPLVRLAVAAPVLAAATALLAAPDRPDVARLEVDPVDGGGGNPPGPQPGQGCDPMQDESTVAVEEPNRDVGKEEPILVRGNVIWCYGGPMSDKFPQYLSTRVAVWLVDDFNANRENPTRDHNPLMPEPANEDPHELLEAPAVPSVNESGAYSGSWDPSEEYRLGWRVGTAYAGTSYWGSHGSTRDQHVKPFTISE